MHIGRFAVVIGTAGMLLGMTTAASAASTSASRLLPKVQTAGMYGGWHHSDPGWKGDLFDGPTRPPTRIKIHLWNVHSHLGPGRYFKDLKHTGRYSQFLFIKGGVWASRPLNASLTSAASTVPVIYASMGRWQHPTVEPGSFPIGAFFYLLGMYWYRWNSVASANGIDNWSNGAAGRPHHWASVIALSRVRDHRGHLYYTRMKIASRGHRTIHLAYHVPAKAGVPAGWFES